MPRENLDTGNLDKGGLTKTVLFNTAAIGYMWLLGIKKVL